MLSRLLDDWRHRPTHRRVWALAMPMIVSSMSVPLVALVDSAVAGHLSHPGQLAAVAVGSAVFTMLVWVCGFLRMGTTGFAAQASGRSDGDVLRRVLLQSLLLGGAMALAMLVLMWPLLPWVLALMKPSATLDALTLGYLHLRLLALPAALANYALTGWLLGTQNARAALGVLLVTNLVNIVLNLLFVFGFGWAVDGIALASVIGAWCGTLYGLVRVKHELARHAGRMDWKGLRDWRHWRPLLAVNRDIFLRSLALQGVFFALAVLGTRLGSVVVAANALLLNGLMLVSFALDGLANAVEAMGGHAIGARDGVALRRALVVAGGWSLLGSAGFAVAFGFGGHLFVDMQTSMASVRVAAYVSLPWLAMLPLVAVWSYLLDGLFVGATRAREMRDSMFVGAVAFALLAWWLRPFDNQGLWLAFLGFMVVRAAGMAWLAWRIQRRQGWVPVHGIQDAVKIR
ncbi:MAG TPA: MATE family efflux transporter [Oleiagrimonas sp.]|nr:MATE family efflux transporter [Oleiagrimonas sp.]